MQKIETGYQPRPLQEYLHAQLKRFNVLVIHRRFGKTVFAINELLDQGFRNTRHNPQYAFIAPTYGQAEKIAWQMLKQYTRNIPGVEFNEAKLRCRIPRPWLGDHITLFLLGAENPDAIRGIYLDGAVLDEFGTMDPRTWEEVVRPALSDRKGWAVFIGTPNGMNHFYDRYKIALKNPGDEWFCKVYKASQTNVIPPEELASMRAEMSDEAYNQEMECDFSAALIGAYFGKQMALAHSSGRIGRVPHDQALLVDTFWDLGIGDTTAIVFIQQYRLEIRVIDYLEMSGEGLAFYAKALKEGERRFYNYRHNEWPHDGAARDLSTGQDRVATMRSLGVKVRTNKRHEVMERIEASRRLIGKCWFDQTKCQRLIDALSSYEKKWDDKNKIFQEKPLHNWASHGSDAFGLAAMVLRPGEDRVNRALPPTSDNKYDIFGV